MPWLTLGIAAINVVVLVALQACTDETVVDARVADLVRFVQAHPYLELSPAGARLLTPRTLDRLAAARDRALSSGLPPLGEFEAARRALDDQEAAVFAAIGDLPTRLWGFVPRDPWSVTLLTSFFMHAGWMHLVGNLLFLWITSPFVEERMGGLGFAGFYLAAGLAGNAAHWMRYPGADIPLVGASGAVAGLMGAFAVFFSRSRIRFLVLPLPVVVALPVLAVMPIWLGEQMWLSRYSDGSNVAFGAHVGGFVFGLAVAGLVRLTERDAPSGAPDAPMAARERLEDAIAAGDVGAMEQAGARVLEEMRRAGGAGIAAFARELQARVRPPLPVRLWGACAAALERSEPGAALALYDDVVRAGPQDDAALRALVRRSEMLRRLGRNGEARRSLQQALAHGGCTAGLRSSVERSLAALDPPPGPQAGC